MKRKVFLIIAIALMAIRMPIKAQNIITLPEKQFQFVYTGVTTDTVGASQTSWQMEIVPNKIDALYSNHSISLSRTPLIADTACLVQVVFQGKYFATDGWSTLGSAFFYGKAGLMDTVVTCPQFTNRVGYNHYQVLLNRTTGRVKVNNVKGVYRK